MALSPRRTLGALAAVPLVLALVAGCSDTDASPAATPTSPSAPASTGGASSSAPTGDSPYPDYVALGDSYTAAPFVPTTDTSNGCLRSNGNYPSLVAKALPGTTLTDVSCSGADATSMVGVQAGTAGAAQPPQFDALSDATDLVTLGLGGNDFGLFATLVGTCTQVARRDPSGSPCTDQLTRGGTDQLRATLTRTRDRLAAVVEGIRDRAPDARILVVGYPQLLPPTGTCPDLLPLAAGDYPYARAISVALSRTVQRATAQADVGAEFVDLSKVTAGHDICSDDPWINGITTDPARALAFHPFAAEQQAAAEQVLAVLDAS